MRKIKKATAIISILKIDKTVRTAGDNRDKPLSLPDITMIYINNFQNLGHIFVVAGQEMENIGGTKSRVRNTILRIVFYVTVPDGPGRGG